MGFNNQRIALAALLLALAGGSAQAQGFSLREVAPGNFVHVGSLEERSPANGGDQANVGFIVGSRCVAVIDVGGSLPVGQSLRAALRRVTDKPVCYVILTHMHPDHVFGAEAFRAEGAEVVAHGNLPAALAQRLRTYLGALRRDLGDLADGAGIAPVTIAVDVDQERVLDLGERRLRLRAWPVAHTDNDLTVLDEATGTLWLGDLLFVDHTPVVDGSITGFLKVMDALAAIPARAFVPGHGWTAAAWPAALAPQRDYLAMIVRDTRSALRARRTMEEAVDTVGASAAPNWTNFDAFHRRNVTAAYAELEWE
jgi:quinoprotein relay system zinc metallohydrolase 2